MHAVVNKTWCNTAQKNTSTSLNILFLLLKYVWKNKGCILDKNCRLVTTDFLCNVRAVFWACKLTESVYRVPFELISPKSSCLMYQGNNTWRVKMSQKTSAKSSVRQPRIGGITDNEEFKSQIFVSLWTSPYNYLIWNHETWCLLDLWNRSTSLV